MYRSRSRRHSSGVIAPRHAALDLIADGIVSGKIDPKTFQPKRESKRRRPVKVDHVDDNKAVADWLARKNAGVIPPKIKLLGESENFATWLVGVVPVTIGRDYPERSPLRPS